MKQTFEIPDGCNRVTIEQQGNKIVTTFEPEFKEGDVISTRCNEGVFIGIVKRYVNSSEVYVHACKFGNDNLGFDENVNLLKPTANDIYFSTDSEREILFDTLAKVGKQWNAEKKCIEDLKPKRWRAEKGCNYFYINSCGSIAGSLDYYLPDNNKIYHFGNYFQTEQQAEAAAEKIKELLKQINS